MDQQFAIAGYTGSSCLMCAIDGADIMALRVQRI